jgi:hypothetical protein
MEDGPVTSSGAISRALASALGKLRRTPGKDEAWIESVLRVIERDDPERYERMRRRVGFVQRISDLAQLRVEEASIATFGVFCHEVIGDKPPADVAPTLWLDYIYRNERWLGPSLNACDSIYAETWDNVAGRPAMIAKFVVAYDKRTLEEHERPLQVIQSIVESARTDDEDRLGPLLWSEDGQELCDFHFRRHSDYKLDAKLVRHNTELLRRVLPPPAGARSTRPGPILSSTQPAPVERSRKARAGAAAPAQASTAFERRRQALRSAQSDRSGAVEEPPPSSVTEPDDLAPEIEEAEPAGAVTAPTPSAPEPEPEPELRPVETLRVVPDETTYPEVEEVMDRTQFATMPAVDGEGINVTRRIETVRAQLDQIRRLAIDTQEMLADLTPQIEELVAWVADLESVLNRRATARRAA